MKRPLLVWLAFAACAIVGFGVLGWFTREMLRLERESTAARRLAAVEENIRLALWRMDSALASVHGLEASRPALDYEPFYRANAAYASDLSALPGGTVLLPSPLLGYTPPFVKLHFQVEPDATVRSPQAPAAGLRTAALHAGIAGEQMDAADARLDELRLRLAQVDLAASLPAAPAAPFSAQSLDTEQRSIRTFDWSSLTKRSNEPAPESEAADVTAPTVTAAPPPAAPVAATSPRDEVVVQQLKSVTEQAERANTLDLSTRYSAEIADKRNRAQAPLFLIDNEIAQAAAPATGEPVADGFRAAADSNLEAPRPVPASSAEIARQDATAPNDSMAAKPRAEAEAEAETETDASAGASAAATQAPAAAVLAPASEGALQALWAGDELVFARRAVIDGRSVVQGAWLDWPELRAWLLSRVSDLLPQADLAPALPGTATTAMDAARRLAFLPAQLMPGPVPVNGRTLASPLRISIGLAWAGAAIGLVALALLLRGTVRLSERRGAFVSAVTHELRTPLTTFRMYTEMLASGMVTDEGKRRGYVDTLHKESERLSHLVENVLSYARLERGRAAARIEDTTPGALLARIEDRLRQRAQQGGLGVRIDFADGTADLPLRTDTTAVEQVLFNLVDNATKYGRPKNGAGEIAIHVARFAPKRLAIRVSDQGPGLTAAARKRVFQPFSKSATEAAHTQPGVGLGLALCRRLARDELHGDLALERTGADGTVFRLELPG